MDVLLIGSGVLPIPPPGWGAVEKAIDGLARGLRESGIHVEVLNRTYSQHPRDEYRFALEVPDLLRERSYDVAHASTPVVGNALLLRGFSYVYTSHSRHWWGARSPTERLGFHLEKRACAGARRVIALSSAVAERMSRVRPPTPSRNVRVIPNGVDTELFRPDWSSRTGRRILGVGAIHPRKRWHLAARVVREIPQAELVLVGPVQDPKYARDLERWIGAPGRLTLTGEIPEADLALQFARSDVYFHPSGSELLSLAVLEREIPMARRGLSKVRQFPLDPHHPEAALEQRAHLPVQAGDGKNPLAGGIGLQSGRICAGHGTHDTTEVYPQARRA